MVPDRDIYGKECWFSFFWRILKGDPYYYPPQRPDIIELDRKFEAANSELQSLKAQLRRLNVI